jgi:hypothetical protein
MNLGRSPRHATAILAIVNATSVARRVSVAPTLRRVDFNPAGSTDKPPLPPQCSSPIRSALRNGGRTAVVSELSRAGSGRIVGSLPGPSRTITVEPLRVPVAPRIVPALPPERDDPRPNRDPHPDRVTRPDRQPVPAQ